MKKLLSLPPNLVESFNDITGTLPSEWFCTSDPVGHKLGSGGGTSWLLEDCRLHENASQPFEEWIGKEKRILLHAGGQSRRLPAYASSGKLLTPIPVFRWARGQRIDQTLLDLQLPLFETLMERAPEKLNTLIASGDVYIRTTEDPGKVPDADVVCYGLWAEPSLARNHGVFMMDRKRPGELDYMLQKPSTDTLATLMPTHFFLMDIGIWILSDRAVEKLYRRSMQNGTPIGYDLYGEFGCALGTHPSQPDGDLGELSVAILPLNGGEFYHFGTSRELLSSTTALQNIVKDQRLIIQQEIKRQPSVFTQNSKGINRFTVDNTNIWVENSCTGSGWKFSEKNIVTGVPENDWSVTLLPGQCVDFSPVGENAYAVRPYGFNDAFRGDITKDETLYLGQPMPRWMEAHRVQPQWLGRTDDLQAADLFPVTEDLEQAARLLNWMLAETPADDLSEEYKNCRRLSADHISDQADLRRLFAARRKAMAQNLPAMAANFQKSVFYQIDLSHTAQIFADNQLAEPAVLPSDTPLMTRIHDAMFRSQYKRLKGVASDEHSDKAFELLRQGLTDAATKEPCNPRMDVCKDQIVWGRCPVRIDVAGGWTDTPPYSLTNGGNVVNFSILLNGQPPLQVYVKPCKEPVVICRSIDLGAMERIETFEQLTDYNRVGSPFSIPKAALALAGFAPAFSVETYATLRQQLEAFGAGIEITLLSAIPAGSGLGTSSILSSTVLGALSDFCNLGWDKMQIGNRTLVLEQLLTTGGGWQDQYGGILPGVKLLQTSAGYDQTPVARWLPSTLFAHEDYRACHLLYYTGLTRTAKNILAEIVRNMFLNSRDELAQLAIMKQHALNMHEAIQKGDFSAYGRLVRATWEQNKRLDSGTNPPLIDELCSRIDDLCLGYKLPGAGGGGYLYMVAKDAQAALRIRQLLSENPLTPSARFVNIELSQNGLQISRS